jgi:hypothetical protein
LKAGNRLQGSGNYPTQANSGLEWGTWHLAVLSKLV